jgi:DNA replication protein DnaC
MTMLVRSMACASAPVKGLEAFDFSYQPSVDKKQIQTLASCHFISQGENVVLLGQPGVGKGTTNLTRGRDFR